MCHETEFKKLETEKEEDKDVKRMALLNKHDSFLEVLSQTDPN